MVEKQNDHKKEKQQEPKMIKILLLNSYIDIIFFFFAH